MTRCGRGRGQVPQYYSLFTFHFVGVRWIRQRNTGAEGCRGKLSLEALAYGATVTRLTVPDRNGKPVDVVLGFGQPAQYRGSHPYFGATAGRVAGRISRAQFQFNDETYRLAANDPPNHLHGGVRGFDKRVWSAEPIASHAVRFSLTSPDGEEGYPGTVQATVTYVLANGTFTVEVFATTDRATPLSLTHHSYFNLAREGSGESIETHELEIFADEFAPADASMGLSGRRERVTDANDFRQPRRLADAIAQLHGRHGDLYFTHAAGPGLVDAARLVHRDSGRVMTVRTNEPCIQFYTGVSLDGSLVGKSGVPYGRHAGLCLECEGYPDGANTPALGDIILRPGMPLRRRTEYAFSTLKC
jgi:aldose 1-epimerase